MFKLDAVLSAFATTNYAKAIGLLSYDSTSIQNLGNFWKMGFTGHESKFFLVFVFFVQR